MTLYYRLNIARLASIAFFIPALIALLISATPYSAVAGDSNGVNVVTICDQSPKFQIQLDAFNNTCPCVTYSFSNLCDESGNVSFLIERVADANDEAVAEGGKQCQLFLIKLKGLSAGVEEIAMPLALELGQSLKLEIPGGPGPFELFTAPGPTVNDYELVSLYEASCEPVDPTPTPSPEPEPSVNPVLNCEILGERSLSCAGEVTTLSFSAAPNFGGAPGGSTLRAQQAQATFVEHFWTYNCLEQNGQVAVKSGVTDGTTSIQIDLESPGDGKPTSCEIGLQVTRGQQSESCSIQANVSACQLDCNGVIDGLGIFDECGICGGDGQTCGENACTSTDITKTQIALDGNARSMARTTVKAANLLSRLVKNKSKIESIINQAQVAQIMTWSEVWSISSTILDCSPGTVLCTSVSLDSTVQEITDLGESTFALGTSVLDMIKDKMTKIKHRRIARRLSKRLIRAHDRFVLETASLPLTQSVCSAPTA